MTESVKPIRLTKPEREALEWLQLFAADLLDGKPVEYEKPIIERLQRMGITMGFVIHKEVKTLVRGKEAPFLWRVTNAPWYIRGSASKHFLPFQIKERKPPK